ncbi:exported hypothetical protein [metagenome]|uniref:Uncharacterized protein n=1 Tax=metagenome TaxID=256318 RepID=A0A2P2CA24_9ZZZZ
MKAPSKAATPSVVLSGRAPQRSTIAVSGGAAPVTTVAGAKRRFSVNCRWCQERAIASSSPPASPPASASPRSGVASRSCRPQPPAARR